MIELVGIRKAFNQGRHNEFWALSGIDLTIPAHRVTALTGPSGSGKTTLLSILGCLARPTEGRVRLDGEDISGLPERFLTEIRRKTFGFVFQQFNLIRGLSALENVILPAYPAGQPRKALLEKAEALLAGVALAHRRDAKVEWLSGGEQQRVAICRALINDPRILIADEPTANLDTKLAKEFLGILEKLADEGRTIILTSHDPLVVDSSIVDLVVGLRDGRIVDQKMVPSRQRRFFS
ncbi:MAG: ABC transporter ATP-binding protein [Rhodocyclaceae bacterium]